MHGRELLLEFMFMPLAQSTQDLCLVRVDGDDPEPPLSADSVANRGFGRLLIAACVDTSVVKKGMARHAITSYVYHLWVCDGTIDVDEMWLQQLLHHKSTSTMKSSYIYEALPNAVLQRYKAGGFDGRLCLTELIRI